MGRDIVTTTGIAFLAVICIFMKGSVIAAEPVPFNDASRVLDFSDFHNQVQPFFNKYCIDCHTEKGSEPDIRFDLITDQPSLEKWTPVLEKAAMMLRRQKMPPKNKPQPTAEERNTALAWLDAYSAKDFDCTNPALRNPGRVTIRRLNRAEYNNTIRDLLATDLKPANVFPADDAGYGFDNIGDVLAIAPVLMEKYINAAGLVLEKAIFADPVVPPPVRRWDAAVMEGTIPKVDPKPAEVVGNSGRSVVNGRVFNYKGEIYFECELPADGEYFIRFRGYGQQRPVAQFMIDGENVGRPITVTEDQRNTKVYSTSRVRLLAGQHRATLAFANGITKEEFGAAVAAADESNAATANRAPVVPVPLPRPNNDEDAAASNPSTARQAQASSSVGSAAVVDGAPALPEITAPPEVTAPAEVAARGRAGARGAAGARGRGAARGGATAAAPGKPTLGVVFIELEGPLEITPERMSESYRRVMVSRPSPTVTKPRAAEEIIRNFASKAYRRPLKEDDVKSLMEIWSKYDSLGESFESSIYTTLQAVLVSPNFLYRFERDPGPEDSGGVRTIDEFELANRLSYFLWTSMPDDELFRLATAGQLRSNLDAQVQRMLKDSKSQALVENFAGQWLKLRMMDFVIPDSKTFPSFDEELRQAMISETQMLFLAILHEDRSILDFIDADFTFLNERLAKHYGIEGVQGNEFRRVQLTSADRGGLLTQASILTITSYPARTSPVQRGKWVLENLFDESPLPPPPEIPALKEQGEIKGTLRQRMEQHRDNPACASCHEQMDAIGFGLENFDAIGVWRTAERGTPIDPAGTLPGGQSFSGPAQLKQIIKSRQDDFCKTLTVKMLTFALGRGLEKYDQCTVDEIVGNMKQNGYQFSVLVRQIVQSEPFQKRAVK